MSVCPKCGHLDPDDFDIPDEFESWPPPGVWKTKEGNWIPYEELGDQHLLNIVAMLERKFHPNSVHATIFGMAGLKREVERRRLNEKTAVSGT
jgi:hypothetical protein